MSTYHIKLPPEEPPEYDIHIGQDLFPQIVADLKANPLGSKYMIITDTNVKGPHASRLQNMLQDSGIHADLFTFNEGEVYKNAKTVVDAWERMGYLSHNRDSAVIAVGGGVVGDLAGFVAATYGRGVQFVQVPTSTISQADSAIGGKTGFDLETAKNMVGIIKQPDVVYLDVDTLKTIAPRHYLSGLTESVKHGVIADTRMLDLFENNFGAILDKDPETLMYLAELNCGVKGPVVMKDPNERGIRKVLNWGHTIGHAVEKLSNFDIHHGEAVAFGIIAASEMAQDITGYPQADSERQNDLLYRLGVVPNVPANITNDSLVEKLAMDKKARNGRPLFVFPERNGEMADFDGVWATYVDQAAIYSALEKVRKDIAHRLK